VSILQIQECQGRLKPAKAMNLTIKEDEIAYLEGRKGTIAIAKSKGFFFYLETEAEERILFTEPEDLIVASSWGVGDKVKRALACTIFQLREMQAPLIVLPKGHPASPRLKVVVSIGERTRCSCQIQPGTHPEQDVLCASQEFHQIEIIGRSGGAEILGLAEEESNIAVQKL